MMLIRNWFPSMAPEGLANVPAPEPTPAPAPDAGTPAPVDTPPTEGQPTDDDVARVLSFDPFATTEAEKPAAAAAALAPNTPAPTTPTPTPAEGAPQGAPAKAPDVDPKAAEFELLKQTVKNYEQQIAALKAPPAAAQPPAQGQPGQPAQEDLIPEYKYTIPEPLRAGLASEDPTEQCAAVGALAQGVSRTVHQQVLRQTLGIMQERIPQMVMGMMEQSRIREQVQTDFYGKNPDLNRPEIHPIVVQQALGLMQETGQSTWSPQFQTALEQRTRAVLASMANLVPPAAAPALPAAPLPYMAGRPAAAAPANKPMSEEEDISRTIFGA